jgi:hypothetical protein
MKNPDLFIIPAPDRLYARNEQGITPVIPISNDSKIKLLGEIPLESKLTLDLSQFQLDQVGRYDPSFGLVFVFPKGTDIQQIEQAEFRWGHHLLPFAYPASRCIARSFGSSLSL